MRCPFYNFIQHTLIIICVFKSFSVETDKISHLILSSFCRLLKLTKFLVESTERWTVGAGLAEASLEVHAHRQGAVIHAAVVPYW